MKNPKSFLFSQDDSGIVTITLNRPERLNALTFEVYRELTDTFAELRNEKNTRVVVITGAGRAFVRVVMFTTLLVSCLVETCKACLSLRA